MKKSLIVLSWIFLLTACGPEFMAGSAFSSLVINDNRDIGTMSDDKMIMLQAQNVIDSDKELKEHANISVSSYNRSVLIVGKASTEQLRIRAANLIRNVPKVRKIYNGVTLGNPSSSTYSDDTWITTKVKSAMVAESKLKSSQIKVVTENGVVYLMGLVLPSQARLAVQVTQGVDGVKKVINLFDYLS